MYAAAGGDNAGTIITGFAIIFGIGAAYFLPAFIAAIRHVPNSMSVAVINLLLGWTIIGWIVCLAMACRSKPRTYAQLPGYYPPQPQGWYPPQQGPSA